MADHPELGGGYEILNLQNRIAEINRAFNGPAVSPEIRLQAQAICDDTCLSPQQKFTNLALLYCSIKRVEATCEEAPSTGKIGSGIAIPPNIYNENRATLDDIVGRGYEAYEEIGEAVTELTDRLVAFDQGLVADAANLPRSQTKALLYIAIGGMCVATIEAIESINRSTTDAIIATAFTVVFGWATNIYQRARRLSTQD